MLCAILLPVSHSSRLLLMHAPDVLSLHVLVEIEVIAVAALYVHTLDSHCTSDLSRIARRSVHTALPEAASTVSTAFFAREYDAREAKAACLVGLVMALVMFIVVVLEVVVVVMAHGTRLTSLQADVDVEAEDDV